MKITYAGHEYSCSRAVRQGDHAVLYLTDNTVIEFVGISENAWNKFIINGGSWELIQETPSDTDRLNALEAAMLVLMGGINNV